MEIHKRIKREEAGKVSQKGIKNQNRPRNPIGLKQNWKLAILPRV